MKQNREFQEVYDLVAEQEDWEVAQKLERSVEELMLDEDVQKKSGIYEFLLCGDEKSFNLRGFDNKTKREAHERQCGICTILREAFRTRINVY